MDCCSSSSDSFKRRVVPGPVSVPVVSMVMTSDDSVAVLFAIVRSVLWQLGLHLEHSLSRVCKGPDSPKFLGSLPRKESPGFSFSSASGLEQGPTPGSIQWVSQRRTMVIVALCFSALSLPRIARHNVNTSRHHVFPLVTKK